MKKLFISLVFWGALLSPNPGFAQGVLVDLRHWASADNTRIVLDVSDGIDYQVVSSETEIAVHLHNSRTARDLPARINLSRSGVKEITLATVDTGKIVVTVTLMEGSRANVFSLPRVENKSERLVIDVTDTEMERQLTRAREEIKASEKRIMVVVDPGHGGEDPGAIGKHGTFEKDIVLEISKKIKRRINAMEGYRAVLTRTGDYFLPFRQRLQIARDYGADLFISIHADASTNRRAGGSSVFRLSTGGAVTEAAKILARRENLADIIGGTSDPEEFDHQNSAIILDMFQNRTINASSKFGALVLDNLKGLTRIRFPEVQHAPFAVLRLPEIPALLIETLFISNPSEEKLLRSKSFQDAFSKRVTRAVHQFFSSGLHPAKDNNNDNSTKVFVSDSVRATTGVSGQVRERQQDPLGDIIRESRQVPVATGVEQKIPATRDKPRNVEQNAKLKAKSNSGRQSVGKGATAEIQKFRMHRVQRGDSLERIASKHDTTVHELVRINGIRDKRFIRVNQTLKVPVRSVVPASSSGRAPSNRRQN